MIFMFRQNPVYEISVYSDTLYKCHKPFILYTAEHVTKHFCDF